MNESSNEQPKTQGMNELVPQVWSCGGGTQSVAIGALIVQGRLPKPDFACIADTGKEMPTTWEYFDAVLKPNLAAVGVDIVRVSREEFASPWGKGMFATSGQLMIPAYSNLNGEPSKLSAFCSGAWKQEVIDRWLSKVHGATRSKLVKWIGFSRDEKTRILRMQAGTEWKAGLIRFPLHDDVPLRRHEAIQLVEAMGWPKPPRSRCWMCPNQSDLEWEEVRQIPELWEQACALDGTIRERDPHAFLHASITPLRGADTSAGDDLFSAGCPSGECFL